MKFSALVMMTALTATTVACSSADESDEIGATDEAAFTRGDVYSISGDFSLREVDTRPIDLVGCFQFTAPCSNPPLPEVDAGPGTVDIQMLRSRAGDTTRVNVRVRRPDFDGSRVTDRFFNVRLTQAANGYSSSVWTGALPTDDGTTASIRLSFLQDGFRTQGPDALRWVDIRIVSDTHILEMVTQ